MEREKSLPTVQLRHKLPDGTHHIDWMIARDAAGVLPLSTWRLARRVDELAIGESAPAMRLPDHRPAYLDYEGPIAGNRGSVTREASGRVWRTINEAQLPACSEHIEAEWHIAGTILTQTLSLSRISDENWIVTCTRRGA